MEKKGKVRVKVQKYSGGGLEPVEREWALELKKGRLDVEIGAGFGLFVEDFNARGARMRFASEVMNTEKTFPLMRGTVHHLNLNFVDLSIVIAVGIE